MEVHGEEAEDLLVVPHVHHDELLLDIDALLDL